MKKRLAVLSMTPMLLLGAQMAMAEGVRMYDAGEVPAASDVANILSGGKMGDSQMMNRPKMRGISLESVKEPETKTANDLAAVAAPPSNANTVVGLPVEFAFNSADILPENRPQLDAVAEGIKMTSGIRVVVEGHTDASGSAAYNKALSLKRAEAVRSYLVNEHGINSSMLVVEGRGESDPLQGTDPYAAQNRRVQLRAAN